MKKITKSILITFLTVIICVSSFPAFSIRSSASTIAPRWTHLNNTSFSFQALSTGGHVLTTYEGYDDGFSKAEVTVKLQKKFLLLFWTDVDEWSSSSTENYGDFYHVFELNGTGTYKATFTLTVTGTDGTVDTVTKEIESKYSK